MSWKASCDTRSQEIKKMQTLADSPMTAAFDSPKEATPTLLNHPRMLLVALVVSVLSLMVAVWAVSRSASRPLNPKRVRAMEKRLVTATKQMEDLDQYLNDVKAAAPEAPQVSKRLDGLEQSVAKLGGQFKTAMEPLAANQAYLDQVQLRLTDLSAELEKAKLEVPQPAPDFKRVDDQITKLAQRVETLQLQMVDGNQPDPKSIQAREALANRMVGLEKKLSRLEAQNETRTAEAVAELESRFKRYQETLDKAAEAQGRLGERLETLQNDLAQARTTTEKMATDVADELAGLGNQLKTLDKRLDTGSGDLERSQKDRQDLSQRLAALESAQKKAAAVSRERQDRDLADLEKRIAGLQEKMQKAAGAAAAEDPRVDKLMARLTALEKASREPDEGMRAMAARLDRLDRLENQAGRPDTRLATIDERLKQVEKRPAPSDPRLDDVLTRLSGLENSTPAANDPQVAQLADRLANLEQELAKRSSPSDDSGAKELEKLTAHLNMIERDLNLAIKPISKMDSSLAQLNNRMTKLDEQMGDEGKGQSESLAVAVNQKLAQQNRKMLQMAQQVAALEARLKDVRLSEALASRLRAGEKNDQVFSQRLDTLETTLLNRMNALGQDVASLERKNQTSNPAVSPAFRPAGVSRYYTVQVGDTLYQISRQFGVTVDQLRRYNQLTSGSSIYPGQRLIVQR